MAEIKNITVNQLRLMKGHEGLIIEGCAGLDNWIQSITEALTQAGILRNGSQFQSVSTFQHDGLTCLLFDFEGADLDIGKLAIWRLQTHEAIGGTWLSDYVSNYLGGFVHEQEQQKPDCKLIGEDGNIFNLMGIASRTLKENGMQERASEMIQRITGGDCNSYGEALNIIGEYVNITGPEEEEDCSYEMEGMDL